MKQNNNQISIDDAREALASIESMKQKSKEICRPPIWLNLFLALLLGIETMSLALSSGANTDHSLWTFVMIVSTALLVIFFSAWVLKLRYDGIKLKLSPQTLTEKIIGFVAGFMVAATLMGTQYLYQTGVSWIPYAGAIMNAILVSYLLYSSPSGESFSKEIEQ